MSLLHASVSIVHNRGRHARRGLICQRRRFPSILRRSINRGDEQQQRPFWIGILLRTTPMLYGTACRAVSGFNNYSECACFRDVMHTYMPRLEDRARSVGSTITDAQKPNFSGDSRCFCQQHHNDARASQSRRVETTPVCMGACNIRQISWGDDQIRAAVMGRDSSQSAGSRNEPGAEKVDTTL
jgi:hypothetical protein